LRSSHRGPGRRSVACSAAGRGTRETSDMRTKRGHARRRQATRDAPNVVSTVIACIAVAGSSLAVMALYWMALTHGNDLTRSYFHSAVALLTGATIAACGALALMVRRNRDLHGEIDRLETQLEDVSDREWQIKEAEEHAKSFLEAQGDVIVRRDSAGRITYVNDAFCALAGRARDTLVGHDFALPVVEQGEVAALPDGTRVHDQQIATAAGLDGVARGAGARGRAAAHRDPERRP